MAADEKYVMDKIGEHAPAVTTTVCRRVAAEPYDDGRSVVRCERCDGDLDQRFRFCPWCSAPRRRKLVAHFRGHPLIETMPVGLRVSRYLVDRRHVRLSIWNGERAVAAISLEEREAARLASFLTLGVPRRQHRFREDLRVGVSALRRELSRP